MGRMKLIDYIKTVGDAVAAEQFGVEIRTIRSWKWRDRRPRPRKAHEIERATKGVVKVSECYDYDV